MSVYKFEMDGNKVCAKLPNFVNLQESPAGFGDTEELAVIDLLENCYRELRSEVCAVSFGNSGSCGDCADNEEAQKRAVLKWPAFRARQAFQPTKEKE